MILLGLVVIVVMLILLAVHVTYEARAVRRDIHDVDENNARRWGCVQKTLEAQGRK